MCSREINKDTLKPGDVVGIKKCTQIGWSYFRYPTTIPFKIKRITPARTKFIMTNGAEFSKNEPFYLISAEAQNETYIAECAKKISRYLSEIDSLQRDGKLYTQDDDFIVKTSELLEQICKSVQK